jgi:GT2 family glycosyltransferase
MQSQHIVVIDNSGDLPLDIFGVTVIKPGGNIGYGAACNIGYKSLPPCEAVLFLNNDLVLEDSEFIQKVRANFEESGADIMSACVRTPEGTWVYRGAYLNMRGGSAVKHTNGVKYVQCDLIAGTSFTVRAQAWEKLWFREDLFLYFEEQDFSFRAKALGLTHVCAQNLVVVHEHHTRGWACMPRYYLTRNAAIVMSAYLGRAWLLYYFFYFVPVRVCFYFMRGRIKYAMSVIRGAIAYTKGERGANARIT